MEVSADNSFPDFRSPFPAPRSPFPVLVTSVPSVLKRIFITKKNLTLITLHTNLTAMKPHFFLPGFMTVDVVFNKGLNGVIALTVDV